jgi:hypothetical protein
MQVNRACRTDVLAADIVGFGVDALDGPIGEVGEATDDLAASFCAVRTGPWISRRRVIVPLLTVNRVDYDAGKVYVSRTKEQIRRALEYDEATRADDDDGNVNATTARQ